MKKKYAKAIGRIDDDSGLEVRIGRETRHVSNAHLADLIRAGYELKKALTEIKEELGSVERDIWEHAARFMSGSDVGTIHISAGEITCTAKDTNRVVIAEPGYLREYLGDDHFGLLVRTKTTYAPEPKLIEMAEEKKEIAKCLKMKEYKPSMTYKEKAWHK